MFGGAGTVADPYRLADPKVAVATAIDYGNKDGRTLVNPRSLTGRVGVFGVMGQSNAGNSGSGGTYTPSNPTKVLNLHIGDGGLYRCADPMLGCDGPYACAAFKYGDKLVTDNYLDYAVFLNNSVGSSAIALWAAGGALNHRIGVLMGRMNALISRLTVTPRIVAVTWQQGESDNVAGTSQAAYAAGLASVISTVQAYRACPVFVSKTSWYGGAAAANVQNAQAAAWNGTTVIQGPNTDVYDGTNRSGPDFTYTGQTAVANDWAAIIKTYMDAHP